MSIIKLYTEEYDPGVTLISNVFIDYLLKDANDAQLKVYLYLIRHIGNHKPFDISDIADEFNHTQSDVIRSLKYWEEKQVISLEFDAHGVITGIELHNVDEDLINPKNNVHMFSVVSGKEDNASSAPSMSIPETKFSASDILEMSKDKRWGSIRSLAESYLQRTLSATDVQTLAHIYKDLSFSASDIDKLFDDCLTEGKTTMRSIKKVAEERYVKKNINPSISAVMNALGQKGVPTSDELSYINAWLSDMNLELVLEGCKKASLATNSNRIKYANGIFANWKEKGIQSIEDMAREEEKYRRNSEAAKKQSVACKASSRSITSTTDKAPLKNCYYDFDKMEREVRYN